MNEKLRAVIFPAVSSRRVGAALLLLRLFVGIAFIQHGSGKLMHPSEFAAEFGIPVWLGLATMLTQVIGGILLIFGALTPLAALGIAGTMLTATVFLIQRGEPFINPAGHSWENSAFYLTAGICLALSGAGPWSLEHGCSAAIRTVLTLTALSIGLSSDNERERHHSVRRLT